MAREINKRTGWEALSTVRMPPQNIEAEISLLGSLLLDGSVIYNIADLIGKDEEMLLLPNESQTSTVIDVLSVEYPQMKEWRPHLRVAVNWEYVPPDHMLHDQDELALIPPVSGG